MNPTILGRLRRARYMTACAVAGILLSAVPATACDSGIQAQEPDAYAKPPEDQFGERLMESIRRSDREGAVDELMAYDQWRMRQGLPSILQQQAPAPRKRPAYQAPVMTLPPEAH